MKWVLQQPAPTDPLATVKGEALSLIELFDAKQIVKPCSGRNCSRTAIRFTVYEGVSSPLYVWCDRCDPYQLGAVPWKLTVIKTYNDALNYVQHHCGGRRSDYRLAIDIIAKAKGFPDRSSPSRIQRFFSEDV